MSDQQLPVDDMYPEYMNGTAINTNFILPEINNNKINNDYQLQMLNPK
jgi:hypothetical protein